MLLNKDSGLSFHLKSTLLRTVFFQMINLDNFKGQYNQIGLVTCSSHISQILNLRFYKWFLLFFKHLTLLKPYFWFWENIVLNKFRVNQVRIKLTLYFPLGDILKLHQHVFVNFSLTKYPCQHFYYSTRHLLQYCSYHFANQLSTPMC